MAGKSVGIVGTGSSAVQVVTEAEKVASEVKIFQLEPNWIMPKNSRDFTAAERRLNRNPLPSTRGGDSMLYFDYDRRQFRSSHARSDGWVNKRRHAQRSSFCAANLVHGPISRVGHA